jgi:apolipoprotein N-acyltransferase
MRVVLFHLIMIACGAGLALAYAPTGAWPLGWLALVPPFWFATAERPRWLLTGGIAFGVAWGAVMLDWLVRVFTPALAPQLWLLIGLMCALAFGLIGYVRRVWGLSAALLLAPVLWVGVEFFRSEIWPLKFAWLALAYSQANNLPFLQSASVIGVYGLSLVMAAFAAAVVYAARLASPWPALGAIAVVAGLHLVGWLHMQGDISGKAGIHIAGAQLEAPTSVQLRQALQQLEQEHPDAPIVVLPEYCLNLTGPSRGYEVVEELARRRWIVVGAKLPAPGGGYYSGVLALAPGGERVFQQEKSVPVPLMDDGLPAERRHLLETPFGKIGIAICYDMDFTFVSNDLVNQGAEFLLYPTMDLSSWGDKQRIQHASLAPLRAIEHRRWVMRVASSGVSCAVDPYGRVVSRQGTNAPGGLVAAFVAMRSDQTLYARAGWLIPWVCFCGTLLVIAGVVITDVRRKLRGPAVPQPIPSNTAPAPEVLVNP